MLYVAVRLSSVGLCGAVLIYEMLLTPEMAALGDARFFISHHRSGVFRCGSVDALAAVFFRPVFCRHFHGKAGNDQKRGNVYIREAR